MLLLVKKYPIPVGRVVGSVKEYEVKVAGGTSVTVPAVDAFKNSPVPPIFVLVSTKYIYIMICIFLQTVSPYDASQALYFLENGDRHPNVKFELTVT